MNDEEPDDDLMPEIIEATQNAITSDEDESEEEIIKEDVKMDEAFETPMGVKVTPIKSIENDNKLISQIKENVEKSKPSDKRKKQLEHLRKMREKKKLLAEKQLMEKMREEQLKTLELQEELKEETGEEESEEEQPTPPPSPKKKKKKKKKKKVTIKEPSSEEEESEEELVTYRNITLNEEELKTLLEEASVNSIKKYKAQKKPKEKKEEKPTVNAVQQAVNFNQPLADYYASLF